MNIKERKISLDYFRILIMGFIVTLHILGVSGLFYNINDGNISKVTINYCFISWLEAFCVSGVNCFVLLSGYFLVDDEFKKNKVISLIGQTLFYSISITIIIMIFNNEPIGINSLVQSFFPVILSKYWFITAYIVLYILSPYINLIINSLNKKELGRLIIILVCIFSGWKTLVPFAPTLDSTKGYGIIWFIVLYFIGAYIKRHFYSEKRSKYYFYIYFLITFAIFIFKISMIYLSSKYNYFSKVQNALYHYNSLSVLGASVALFIAFVQKSDLRPNKWVMKISGLTLGVYLIHEHFLFREILWLDIVKIQLHVENKFLPIIIFISVFGVFISCILIEYLRKMSILLIKKFTHNI